MCAMRAHTCEHCIRWAEEFCPHRKPTICCAFQTSCVRFTCQFPWNNLTIFFSISFASYRAPFLHADYMSFSCAFNFNCIKVAIIPCNSSGDGTLCSVLNAYKRKNSQEISQVCEQGEMMIKYGAATFHFVRKRATIYTKLVGL